MSLENSWLEERDGVRMALLGVGPNVDTGVRTPAGSALTSLGVDDDGVASSIRWRFDGGSGRGVTYDLGPFRTVGRRNPELLPSPPSDMIVHVKS